ncbi:MAG: manganese efflux pump MntP family protein [bacterium]
MSLLTIFLISLGLAMDAFAVSIGIGVSAPVNKMHTALKASITFGLFQSIMPVIGWFGANQFKDLIGNYDHWIAFSILLLIGLKMIYEAIKMDKICEKKDSCVGNFKLFVLAIATSIDALAVGVSFSFLNIFITLPVIVIGVVTFVLSFIGVEIGNRLGCYAKTKAEILGGSILIILGIKILLEHFKLI